MKKIFDEFKSFAVKGNMVDLAIGIIIGAAFKDVINTIVKKVAMPPLSLMTDSVNLSNLKVVLRQGTETVEEVAIGYGELVEVLIDFSVIALTIFIVIKFMNKLKRQAEDPKDPVVETPKNIELLSNIQGLIEEQNALLKQARGGAQNTET